MNEPLVVSIPHTGTRFIQARLDIREFVHTHKRWDLLYEQVKDRKIIAPLRNPNDVWVSTARRQNPETKPFPYARFFGAWNIMHTLDMLFDVDFICVDKREDPRITDWSPEGHNTRDAFDWPPISLGPLYRLPFVRRHYGSWQASDLKAVG